MAEKWNFKDNLPGGGLTNLGTHHNKDAGLTPHRATEQTETCLMP